MAGCIYLIANKSNSKCYVGQTTKGAEYRWKQHIKCSKYKEYQHYALYRAFSKYGMSRAIMCEQNGVTYGSIVEAATTLGLKLSSVQAVCRGTRNSVFGYTFKYKDNK